MLALLLHSFLLSIQLLLFHQYRRRRQPGPRSLQAATLDRQATTALTTTAKQWGVEESTLLRTVELWLSGHVITTWLVEQVFRCAARRGVLPDDVQIAALAAQARRSTSRSQDFSESVAPSTSDVAASPSGSEAHRD